MAFSVTGVVTVTDVRDGVTPPSVLLTNESHTFAATAGGIIVDMSGFSCEAQVYVGTDAYTYTTNASPTGTTFTIVSGSIAVLPSNADLSVSVSSTGEITVSDGGGSATGFDDDDTINNVTITIPVKIAGISANINKVITLSKSLGGSAPLVRIESNTQTVEYDQEGDIARTDNIVITANELNFNDHANATWEYRAGSSGAFSALSGTGISISQSSSNDDPEVATITPAAFNTLVGSSNRSITVRARRGGTSTAPQYYDQITIAKVFDGASAISVVISPTSGSTILRSDTDVVVLRADVYKSGTLLTPGSWTYSWSKDGTVLTSANQATLTGATQQTGEGYNQRSLRVEGDGITDNTASLFSVTVTES